MPGSEIPVRTAAELISALKVNDPNYQKAAKAAIERANPELVKDLLSLRGHNRREVGQRLIVRMGRKAVPTLLSAMDDEATAAPAGGALTQIVTAKDADLIPELLSCAATKPLGGNYCARALASAASPAAAGHVKSLADCLGAARDEVKPYCALALNAVGAKAAPAVPALVRAVSSPLPVLRAQAAAALGAVGPAAAKTAAPVLRAAAEKDASADVRKAAKAALRRIGV